MTLVLLVVLAAPRKWALLGLMAGVLYLPETQQVQIAGFNLTGLRFVELAGFLRVMGRREFSFTKLNGVDRALLLLYAYTTIVFLLRSQQDQAYQIGVAVDAYLSYFAFRGLVGGVEDFRWFLRAFAVLLATYVPLVMYESFTNNNIFASMGVSMRNGDDWFRDGRLRCIGSFRHPSLLGSLGASLLPLYVGLLFPKADRLRAIAGIVLCLAIVWASNSGGPMSCAAAGMVGWMLWKLRTKMQLFRRIMVGFVLLMALVMKAPIWFLLERISDVTGGDGWHRSELINQAYLHLNQWWLAGVAIPETHDWLPYAHSLTGGVDMTDQFLEFGINAGLIAMVLFIVLLVRAFKLLGLALAVTRTAPDAPNENEYLLWGLGAMLAGHIFNWMGITYFDQFHVVWFMQLAAIVNLSEDCIQSARTARSEEVYATTDAPISETAAT